MPTRAAPSLESAEQAVREANRRFYLAFAALDMELMDQVWLHEDWVQCVHPGWDLLIGWEEVRESWLRIFTSTQRMNRSRDCVRSRMRVTPLTPNSCRK